MAAVYKIGKKWRADWTDNEGIRHRMRFNTKGQADAALAEIASQLNAGTDVAPKKIPTFGALADSWITGRIEQSKTPGAGYRPSSLAQWQSHIAHMKTSFDLVRASETDAQAIERAIAKWRLPKEEDGRGLSTKTVGKVLTKMSRIFKFGMRNRCGVQLDPDEANREGQRGLGRAERNG